MNNYGAALAWALITVILSGDICASPLGERNVWKIAFVWKIAKTVWKIALAFSHHPSPNWASVIRPLTSQGASLPTGDDALRQHLDPSAS